MNFHAHKSYFNILKLFAVVGSISLLSLSFFFLNHVPAYETSRPKVNTTQEPNYHYQEPSTRMQQSCVTSMKDLEQRTNSAGMTFVLPPYKAGGSSLYMFQQRCNFKPSKRMKMDKVLRDREMLKDFFELNEEVPKFLMTHVDSTDVLTDLIYHASPDSLIIFLYRNERDRLVSAVKHILEHRACGSWGIFQEHYEALVAEKDVTKCLVREEALVEFIRSNRPYEIGGSVRNILSCELFDLIRENDPNILFMEYSKQDELQRILAKGNCPELIPQIPMHTNTSGGPLDVFIVRADGKQVPIKEWLKGKAHLLELLTTPQSDQAGCGLERKQIEEAISFCPESTVSSSLFLRS